jgi:hypothetical protein
MYVGYITGFAFFPVSIIMFLNIFGKLKLDSIFGINLILLGAIGLIAVQIGDIFDSHVQSSKVILMWVSGIILSFPGILYLISKIITIQPALASALPIIIASFLFSEGVGCFHIGE